MKGWIRMPWCKSPGKQPGQFLFSVRYRPVVFISPDNPVRYPLPDVTNDKSYTRTRFPYATPGLLPVPRSDILYSDRRS